ncbi:ankyrin repeat domain-containing protein [Actinomadura sp. 9N407]|uniref:ankyrin repeat domain-containing protein n=1 Tax=Actinomadura sp. 9N407 TaxID=3375154 RepID=UPI0037A82A87
MTADGWSEGLTALWHAVFENRPDDARALAAASADPWRPMMAGWSPGRLSLAGATPDLFGAPPAGIALSTAEAAAVAEASRLIAALGDFHYNGTGLACVAGISAEEAARRLAATPAEGPEEDEPHDLYDLDDDLVGATDVPGGCVLTQPWGYAPQTSEVMVPLSAGTFAYGLYANPSSGNQGSIARDGIIEGWDLHPGGGAAGPGDSAADILAAYLYQHAAVAYCCAYAGLRLTDAQAIVGPPDIWLSLP